MVPGSSETAAATLTAVAAQRASTSTPEEGRFAPGTVLAQRLALAAYSLRTALAGRPLLKEDFL